MSVDFGMLLDWRVPAGKEPYMKEALEQVVDLLRTPARKPNESKVRIPTAVGHGFQFLSDSIPISAGHRSDSCRTVFRADGGQFLGAIGMVSGRIGRVSEMARNGVRHRSETGAGRSGATLE